MVRERTDAQKKTLAGGSARVFRQTDPAARSHGRSGPHSIRPVADRDRPEGPYLAAVGIR